MPIPEDIRAFLKTAFAKDADVAARRAAATALGRRSGATVLADPRVAAAVGRRDGSVLLVCGPEDADTFARGMLEALGGPEAVRLSCFWSGQRRPEPEDNSGVVPTVRRYDEPLGGEPRVVVVARAWLARPAPVRGLVLEGRDRAGAAYEDVIVAAGRAERVAVRPLVRGMFAVLPSAGSVVALSSGRGGPADAAAAYDAERAFHAGLGLPDGGAVHVTPELVRERVPVRLRLLEEEAPAPGPR